jgi:hypothetical protein
MLGALAVGARRDRADVVGAIAVLMVAGILGEPNTWETLRRPRTDPLSTMCVLLQIALPVRLARLTRVARPSTRPAPVRHHDACTAGLDRPTHEQLDSSFWDGSS